MGNYKFRLSDMIPNAWFYKLRDMSSVRNHNHHQYPTGSKKKQLLPSPTTTTSNYHYKYNSPTNPKALDTHFLEPPRKSSSNLPKGTRTTIRKTIYYKQQSPKSIITSNPCSCGRRATPPEPTRTEDSLFSQSPSPNTNILEGDCDGHEYFSCRVSASSTDIIIDMNQRFSSYSTKIQKPEDGFGTISELDQLPPILTKVPDPPPPMKNSGFDDHSETFTTYKDVKRTVPQKPSTTGVKLRSNSPRIVGGRRSVSKKQRNKKGGLKGAGGCSVAIVKSSLDPQGDFTESMMEMIVENNIRGPKALEELLACYLSLNSAEYHPLIVKAFHHIWLCLPHLQK